MYNKLRKLIFKLDPEKAHKMAIYGLKKGLFRYFGDKITYPILKQNVMGLQFKNPIGLAAGFDKDACALKSLQTFGFGFIEAGTSTPQPQHGNSGKRIFRLEDDSAVINRLGFNNKGAEVFVKNLKSFVKLKNIVVGANIGKNKDQENAMLDYEFMFKKVYPFCDYITLNVSSPNTEGLRKLQDKEALNKLLQGIVSIRNKITKFEIISKPIVVKLAPDLTDSQLKDALEACMANEIDGVIIGNTTQSRSKLRSKSFIAEGGLSGRPLYPIMQNMVRKAYKILDGRIPIIACGGIASASDAVAIMKIGASLIQIYTAFIYDGFGLVEKMKLEMSELLHKEGVRNISEIIGVAN